LREHHPASYPLAGYSNCLKLWPRVNFKIVINMSPVENSNLPTWSLVIARYGTGNQDIDLVILLLALFIIGAFLGLSLRRSAYHKKLADNVERLSSLGGKLERIERSLNEFRSEVLRSLEILKGGISTDLPKKDKQQIQEPSQISTKRETPVIEPQISVVYKEVRQEVKLEERREEKVPEAPPVSTTATTPPPLTPEVAAVEGDVSLSGKLAATRKGLFSRLKSLFTGGAKIEPASLERLEEICIEADLGVALSQKIIAGLEESVKAKELGYDLAAVTAATKKALLNIFENDALPAHLVTPSKRADGPLVIMVVGVNGVGKTTTIAKLAAKWGGKGAKVLMVAADTFRAGAVEQLKQWGERLGVPVVSGAADAKPSTVVFDGMVEAKKIDADVVLIDTAGRLHNKTSLMQELSGLKNTIVRHQPSAPHEVLLVLDGSTGQNALSQAREFHKAVDLSGVIVTKLDGTPRGGIVAAIRSEFKLPLRYIGVGEKAADLRPFDPQEFVDALIENPATE